MTVPKCIIDMNNFMDNWGSNCTKTKNIEPRPKFTGSYNKKKACKQASVFYLKDYRVSAFSLKTLQVYSHNK